MVHSNPRLSSLIDSLLLLCVTLVLMQVKGHFSGI